jgi:putative transposase
MPTHGRARSPNAPQGPQRKKLPHDIPAWVKDDAIYFLTLYAVPRSNNHLCHPDLFQRLCASVVHRETLEQWWVPLLLLMPDHLHMLVSFRSIPSMVHTVSAWKRYTARHLDISWQEDFYEHRLRRDESFVEKADYIRLNPMRAGLVSAPEAWPYVRDMTR